MVQKEKGWVEWEKWKKQVVDGLWEGIEK